ncbi:MAG: type II 3-dehydroquinate dehydratase [Emcibacter sp.]|nr:type II 3-dehydroquinate dehydratase [Emcibacter sp.]
MIEINKKNILVLNGPNLNMLGKREPDLYGSDTLGDIDKNLTSQALTMNYHIDFRQSNSEGDLIGWIQDSRDSCDAIIINAGAYTHTSIGILDALRLIKQPIIEVHLSNIFKREDFRHHSYISPVAHGVICGFGSHSYILALQSVHNILSK